jgi:hypothetical protein
MNRVNSFPYRSPSKNKTKYSFLGPISEGDAGAGEGITLPVRPSNRKQIEAARGKEESGKAEKEEGRRRDCTCTRGAAAAASQCGRKKSGGFGGGWGRLERLESVGIDAAIQKSAPILFFSFLFLSPISFPAQAAQSYSSSVLPPLPPLPSSS